MRPVLPAVLMMLTVSCTPSATEPEAPSGASARNLPVAFVGVNVVPMDSERVVPGQTVIVENGRITAMGPAEEAEIPDGAFLVDGGGKYLMPGLAEMHGHIPPLDESGEYIESVLFMYVANGITTVRGMLGSDGQLGLRDRANNGESTIPTLYLAGPSFNDSSINSPRRRSKGSDAESRGMGFAQDPSRIDHGGIRCHGRHRGRGGNPVRWPRTGPMSGWPTLSRWDRRRSITWMATSSISRGSGPRRP